MPQPVEAAPDLARRGFDIRTIPTLLIFNDIEAVGLPRGAALEGLSGGRR